MRPHLSALRICLIYLVLAISWVLLSEHFLQLRFGDSDEYLKWMSEKKYLFLAVTAAILYVLLLRQFKRQAAAYAAMEQSEQRLNRALEAVEDGIWDWDLRTNKVFYSPGFARLFGLPRESLSDEYELWESRLHPEDREATLAAHQAHLAGDTPQLDCVYRLLHTDGSYRWIHSRGRVIRDESGEPLRMTGVCSDITDQRSKDDYLRQAAAVFETTQEGLLVTDLQGTIVHVNPSFTRITGYSADEVLGHDPSMLKSGRQDATFYKAMWHALLSEGAWNGEIWNRRKSGEVYPQWQHIRAVYNEQGQLTHYVALFSDLSNVKRSQKELEFLVHRDPLTGLPNRLLLRERIEQAMAHAEIERGSGALLVLDLDHFKHINDSLGHAAGDLLIKAVAERLRECLDENSSLARLGADEFAVVLRSQHEYHASRTAQRLLEAMHDPFYVDGNPIYMSVSLGVSLYPDDAQDVDHLLQHADAALFQAKASGRNAYAFYTPELTARAHSHVQVEAALRQALERDELRVFFQPVHEIASGRVVGAEALVRWQHPHLGMVPPGMFIPVAEESGLITSIDAWVLQQACRQIRSWLDQGIALDFVAVNLSSRLFNRGGLMQRVESVLKETGLPAHYLELEVTESAVMQNVDQALQQLSQLRMLGVRLAIDDFGTGYSSLMRLKKMPVHKLKIDQGFIAGLPDDSEDAAIACAVIALAHSMGLKVVAEGVEHADQAAFLREYACDMGQGYWYGRPRPASEMNWQSKAEVTDLGEYKN
ncbi:putative bifunctional diguanylate cyclase/phosphodiesterase [Pseudomonas schmalbachii]|uniref:EAL domain-containing protein n=1 Tax=Pseudomonas schmalbachii TaxID=2816993 RepID=A0ABS3TR86_9PSED|nr:GGDEF and EAL domain-containing protein [Pseudomonas schmalbachii]MBO3276186.1 EAL domain-containing protein [Pseudomonas schmalbachii]